MSLLFHYYSLHVCEREGLLVHTFGPVGAHLLIVLEKVLTLAELCINVRGRVRGVDGVLALRLTQMEGGRVDERVGVLVYYFLLGLSFLFSKLVGHL